MKLPKSKSHTNGYLVLDFSPTSLKTLSFEQDSDSKKLSLKGFSISDSYKDLLRKEVVKSSVNECLSQSNLKATDAIIGLSGPEVFGFTLIAKVKRKNPEKQIDEKEISSVYDQVRDACYEQAKKKWSFWSANEDGFEPLDLVVTSIQVDEAVVSEPIGDTGEFVRISVFCSYSSKKYYKWILNLINDLKFSSITVTTTIYSQAKLIGEGSKNFLLVDIGKDYTDVACILGKNIIQSRSFEIGGSYFSRYLVDKHGSDFASANSKKEAFALGTLDEESMDKFGDSLYDASKVWRTAFATALDSMSGIKSFPHRIYLSGGGSLLSMIQEVLLEDEWRKAVPFANDIDIFATDGKSLDKNITDELNVLDGSRMFATGTLGVIKLELDEADEL
ncbi:hypothetical protein A2713_01275 [candidate division WWE3 bacterium RIFCSPHIGHO2_01_FULL_35_17]|uniref:SHS2 domain-containing protein n=1 Tax=candidate division WWE3 bacterium RIFCSPHIGHO2_01_FULL_35_17 TaxID=1802614 RepID=A0A1F4USQ9_UNCKA|nr:MAG: hypothetical protein A2713_01275 [candidate division WWE3 bacterium RIFCSPHIGHO2_01_FULL_35_17]